MTGELASSLKSVGANPSIPLNNPACSGSHS